MRIAPRIALTAASLWGATAALGTELSGKWLLYIENSEHRVVTTAKIVFTDKPAPSCMSGEWKVVAVVSTTTKDKGFFPVAEPLSYWIENGQLTIGRNEVCDAYLWLQGKLAGGAVQGSYFSLWPGGSTPRGYFKLSQAR